MHQFEQLRVSLLLYLPKSNFSLSLMVKKQELLHVMQKYISLGEIYTGKNMGEIYTGYKI